MHTGFRQAEVPDLAFPNQTLDGAGNVFDRDVRIDAVLIEEIDAIRLEPFERCLGNLPDVCGPAVQARLLAVLELEPELRRNHHAIAHRRERFADELLVRVRDRKSTRLNSSHRCISYA